MTNDHNTELMLAMEILYESFDFDKRNYISYRYSGFNHEESCQLSDIKSLQVRNWLEEDLEFATAVNRIKGKNVIELRKLIHDTLRDRNERLFLELDEQVLSKAVGLVTDEDGNLVKLNKDEFDYLKRARGVYTGNANQPAVINNNNIVQLIQERHAKRQSDTRQDEESSTALE